MIGVLVTKHRVAVSCSLFYKNFKKRLCISARHCVAKPSYWHNPGNGPLAALTTGQLIDIAASEWGPKEALVSVHQGHRYTYHEMKEHADQLAAGFLAIGLKPGDRIGMWGPNSSQWYLTFMAAARAGLVLVNINPGYQTNELHYCLTKVGVKALVAPETFKSQKYHDMLTSIAPELNKCEPGKLQSNELPDLRSLIMISENKLPGAYQFDEVVARGTPQLVTEIQKLQNHIQPDDGCNLQFTSGTTGRAKATLLSHHSTVNNMLSFGRRLELFSMDHRICLQVPLFHCFGNVLGLLAGLCYGSAIVLPGPSFKAEESLKAIEEERCTTVYGTPTMFVDLLAKAKESKRNFDSFDIAVLAGAPVSKELIYQLTETFSLKRISEGYGMTETSPLSFASLPNDPLEKITSAVGYIMDHIEAKVVDEKGKMVPFGKPGELWIRGYATMLGYWDEEAKTKETIGSDKWLKTGDQFILHEDGYGQIVGRLKDMIIRGGENIFPVEIEYFLEDHPEILEAQVLGVPDKRMGEELCACIRLVKGSALTPEQIKEYCKGKIAHFKIPRYIKIMTEFPKTQSGKIQKFQLKNMLMKEGIIAS